jgi:hypothetical protein
MILIWKILNWSFNLSSQVIDTVRNNQRLNDSLTIIHTPIIETIQLNDKFSLPVIL